MMKEHLIPELEKRFNVYTPLFPIEEEATHNKWETIMDNYFEQGLLNEDTVVITHSLGSIFFPRYLADRKVKIKLFISLAGSLLNNFTDGNYLKRVIDDFRPTPEQIKRAIEYMPIRYALYSDNDHFFDKRMLEDYAELYEAEKVLIPGVAHMGRTSGITKLPEVLSVIDKEIKQIKKGK